MFCDQSQFSLMPYVAKLVQAIQKLAQGRQGLSVSAFFFKNKVLFSFISFIMSLNVRGSLD